MLQQFIKNRQTLFIIVLTIITFGMSNHAIAQNAVKTVSEQDTTKETIDSNGVYKRVRTIAEFPEGSKKMYTFIIKNLKFRNLKKGIVNGATVRVKFIVSKTGTIRDAKITKSFSPDFDQEALRVINKMPTWIPARNAQGENVDMYYTIPITIRTE